MAPKTVDGSRSRQREFWVPRGFLARRCTPCDTFFGRVTSAALLRASSPSRVHSTWSSSDFLPYRAREFHPRIRLGIRCSLSRFDSCRGFMWLTRAAQPRFPQDEPSVQLEMSPVSFGLMSATPLGLTSNVAT